MDGCGANPTQKVDCFIRNFCPPHPGIFPWVVIYDVSVANYAYFIRDNAQELEEIHFGLR